MATRYEDIRNKLAFALTRLNELSEELMRARTSDGAAAFLGQKVGEILSACRECFDYCAKDLAETFLPKSPKTAYFPFSNETLGDKPWSSLAASSPAVHVYLSDLATRIARNAAIGQTSFGHKRIREINNLVNAKKHDKITRVTRPDNASTIVEFGSVNMLISPIYPMDGEVPDFGADVQAQPMVGNDPTISIKYVAEYHLTDNNWEAGRYGRHAVESSWRILDEVYRQFFSKEPEGLNPYESIKSPEQKEFEALLKRASPIETRVGVVGLFQAGIEQLAVHIRVSGRPASEEPDNAFVAEYFLDAFYEYGWPCLLKKEFDAVMPEQLKLAEREGFRPRDWEAHIKFDGGRQIQLPSGRTIQFDEVIWHLHTAFRFVESAHPSRYALSAQARARAVELFRIGPPKTVVGTQAIGGPPKG